MQSRNPKSCTLDHSLLIPDKFDQSLTLCPWGRFHKQCCALRPTFEKLFRGVEHALRRAPNFDRSISMICAVRPTLMKSTPGPGAGSERRIVIKNAIMICQILLTSRGRGGGFWGWPDPYQLFATFWNP